MSDLYDTDVFDWSQQQADLLRRHAAGEKLNEQPDWANRPSAQRPSRSSWLSTNRSPVLNEVSRQAL